MPSPLWLHRPRRAHREVSTPFPFASRLPPGLTLTAWFPPRHTHRHAVCRLRSQVGDDVAGLRRRDHIADGPGHGRAPAVAVPNTLTLLPAREARTAPTTPPPATFRGGGAA